MNVIMIIIMVINTGMKIVAHFPQLNPGDFCIFGVDGAVSPITTNKSEFSFLQN